MWKNEWERIKSLSDEEARDMLEKMFHQNCEELFKRTEYVSIESVPCGSHVRYGANRWIVLDTCPMYSMLLSIDTLFEREFDRGMEFDWKHCELREYLNSADFLNRAGINKDDLCIIRRDLTAEDGLKFSTNIIDDLVTLMSTNEYRNYRNLIKPLGCTYWLLTVQTLVRDSPICIVSPDGVIDSSEIGEIWGVRPTIRLKQGTKVMLCGNN